MDDDAGWKAGFFFLCTSVVGGPTRRRNPRLIPVWPPSLLHLLSESVTS